MSASIKDESLDKLNAKEHVADILSVEADNEGFVTSNRPKKESNDVLFDEAPDIEDGVAGINELDSDVEDDNENDESEDDNDTDDDLSESENIKEYDTILEHLKQNQYDYKAYVRLCEVAEQMGDWKRLRNAYNLFATAYPLTPSLWLKYLNIRIPLAHYESERVEVCKIFVQALRDYYGTILAHKIAQFLSSAEVGVDKSLWKELDVVYGLNYTTGHEIFRLRRETIANDNQLSDMDKVQHTLDVYRIELKYPLQSMEEAYISCRTYMETEKDKIAHLEVPFRFEQLLPDYEAAKKLREKIRSYEVQIVNDGKEVDPNDNGRVQIYFDYLTFLDSLCNKNDCNLNILHQLCQTVYERLLADYCLVPAYWQAYIDYVEKRASVGNKLSLPKAWLYEQTPLEITMRALRNCYSEELYIKAMRLREKAGCSDAEIREILELALNIGSKKPELEVSVYLEYLSYLTRNTDYGNEDRCDNIRRNFEWAWKYLGNRWGDAADVNCEILQLWGRVEYEFLADPKEGRKLWTTVMASSDNGSKSALWVLFAQLESRYSMEHAAGVFSRALEQIDLDNPHVIVSSWKLLERTHGSIASLNACYTTADFLLQPHLQAKEHQATEAKMPESTTSRRDVAPKRNRQDLKRKAHPSKRDESEAGVSGTKNPKFAKPKAPEEPDTKSEPDIQIIDVTKDNIRVFLNNLDYQLNEEDVRKELSEFLKITNIELKRSSNGKSRGFGFMELETPNEVQKALQLDRHMINGRPVYISLVQRDANQRKKFDYTGEKEPNKVFIKGLPSDCTQEELDKIFGEYGKLRGVRLVYHKSGNFKQIAYAEYEDEADAGKAVLATDKMELRGAKLTVAISNPPARPMPGDISDLSQTRSSTAGHLRQTAKPRMSLIPSVVRQKMSSSIADSSQTIETKPPEMKSNADFRKLLMK